MKADQPLFRGKTALSRQGQSLVIETGDRHPEMTKRMFKARLSRFDSVTDRALIDELAIWVEEVFRDELVVRPSKHVYLNRLPEAEASATATSI